MNTPQCNHIWKPIYRSGYEDDAVDIVNWCSVCGAVYIEVQVDGRVMSRTPYYSPAVCKDSDDAKKFRRIAYQMQCDRETPITIKEIRHIMFGDEHCDADSETAQ